MRNKLIIIIALALVAACIIRRRKRDAEPEEAENYPPSIIEVGGMTIEVIDTVGSLRNMNDELNHWNCKSMLIEPDDNDISDEDWLAQMKEWYKDE